jgi:hypothetical protein
VVGETVDIRRQSNAETVNLRNRGAETAEDGPEDGAVVRVDPEDAGGNSR